MHAAGAVGDDGPLHALKAEDLLAVDGRRRS